MLDVLTQGWGIPAQPARMPNHHAVLFNHLIIVFVNSISKLEKKFFFKKKGWGHVDASKSLTF